MYISLSLYESIVYSINMEFISKIYSQLSNLYEAYFKHQTNYISLITVS